MIYFCRWSVINQRPHIPSGWYLKAWANVGIDIPAGKEIDPKGWFTKLVKESKDDSFCFVLGKGPQQEYSFKTWIKENGLEDWLAFEQPYYSTNEVIGHNHRDKGGGLKVYVLQSPQHFQRQAAKDEPNVTEENFINFINGDNHEETES